MKKLLFILFLPSLLFAQRQSFYKVNADTLRGYKKDSVYVTSKVGIGTAATDSSLTALNFRVKGGIRIDSSARFPFLSTGIVTVTSGVIGSRASDTVGLASALAGKQGSGTYLIPSDSTNVRGYSNSLYLKNADSTTERTYSNSLYLAKTTVSGLANPSQRVGASVVNGSAITGLRSDGAPALDTTYSWTWTGLHKWKNRIYIDSSGNFIDRNARVTIQDQDTSLRSLIHANIWSYTKSRGDGVNNYGGMGGYFKVEDDSTKGFGTGVGMTISASPYRENNPYTANFDYTNLVLDKGTVNTSTKLGTEYLYIGTAGAPGLSTTAFNPYGFSNINGIKTEDRISTHIALSGTARIGIDLSGITYVGGGTAIKTGLADTSILGRVGFGTATIDSQIATSQGVHVGRGLSIDGLLNVPTGKITEAYTETVAGTNASGISTQVTGNPVASSGAAYQNFFGANTQSANAQTFTGSITLKGISGQAIHNGTNTMVGAAAVYADMRNSSSGSITGSPTTGGAYGVNSRVLNLSTGSITNAYGYYASIQNSNAGGNITNAYGLYIDNYTRTGPVQHAYGVYQVEAADTNYFAGFMGIGTNVPSTMLSVAEKFNVNSSGQVTKVNNIATEGPFGVPTIVDTVEKTGQTGSISATALNGTTIAGAYEVSYYGSCTVQNGTSTVLITIDWDNGVKSSASTTFSNASTANYVQGTVYIRHVPVAASSIRWSTTVGGTIGTAQYQVSVTARRLY